MPFQCTIVTPEQQTFDQSVEQVILPASDGMIGILENRSPVLMKLGAGPLQVDIPGGKKAVFYVEGGVAQMKDNKLTLITQAAVPAAEISMELAQAELATAEAMPSEGTEARIKRSAALARANGKLAVSRLK
jgi:F-type H+-transporting ATPase subunit epsilon